MLPLRDTSEFIALQEQGSVTIKGQAEVLGLGCYMGTLMSEGYVKLTPTLLHLGILGEVALGI